MSQRPNVLTLSNSAPVDGGNMIDNGDMAVILKANGSVCAVSFGYNSARLALPEDELTEHDLVMKDHGERLFALAFAAQNDHLMNLLLAIAEDPEIVGPEALAVSVRKH